MDYSTKKKKFLLQNYKGNEKREGTFVRSTEEVGMLFFRESMLSVPDNFFFENVC